MPINITRYNWIKIFSVKIGMAFKGPAGDENGNLFDTRPFQILQLQENSPIFIFINYSGLNTTINTWIIECLQTELVKKYKDWYNKHQNPLYNFER